MGRALRWVAACSLGVSSFATVWLTCENWFGLDREVATAMAGLAFAVVTLPMSWWAGREMLSDKGKSVERASIPQARAAFASRPTPHLDDARRAAQVSSRYGSASYPRAISPQWRRDRGTAPLYRRLAPVVVIALAIAGPVLINLIWPGIRSAGGPAATSLADWVLTYPVGTAGTAGFIVLSLVISWIAHIRGRLRAWVAGILVEVAIWQLFWSGLLVPPLRGVIDLDRGVIGIAAISVIGVIAMILAGSLFWFLEAREEWRKQQRSRYVDTEDDVYPRGYRR